MTCWWDAITGDVYDHTGTLVGNLLEDTDWDKTWTGEFPHEVLDVLYAAREGNQPSAYNQELLFCLAAEQIEEGTPP